MATGTAWPMIHGERQSLLDDLEPLEDQRFDTPSLCGRWTVHDVLGHLTSLSQMTPSKFFIEFAGAGFRFNEFNERGVARETAGGPLATLAHLREHLSSRTHPPGPIETVIGETIVHGEDIRRPLGIGHSYPTEALVRTANFYRSSNLIIGAKRRVSGLKLRATDAQWSAGSGPEVAGPLLSIVLAMTGRRVGLEALSGEGLETLATRV